jgi:DUF3006 family protein
MTYYVVDRIEGKVAVVIGDDGQTFDVPVANLPKGSKEGTVLRVEMGKGSMDWSRAQIDTAERDRRLKAAREKLDRLRASDPGGDVEL